jgi:hypothetical protein
MDQDIMELLLLLVRGRNEFFSNSNIRLLNYPARSGLMTRYMNSESFILELVNRLYTNHLYSSVANAVITLALPARFNDPVVVAPSQLQINASLEAHDNPDSPCAICQDPITTGGARIRQCQHSYHRACISNWFSMSVRCPVCRYDIREAGQPAQTSSASAQTTAQSEDQ